MEIYKTHLFFSDYDHGQSYVIDTIWHKGYWWLVASWLESNDTGERTPERLVRLSGLQYQEVEGEPYRFLLNNAIPKSVFDGKPQDDYVISNHPEALNIQGPKSVH